MQQYLDLVQKIISEGVDREDRTGVGSRAVWGEKLEFDLAEGFPAITTRKVAFRIAFEETMFFLRGETDTKKLEEKNINIWKGNTTREFLDSRGLTYLPEGDMGLGYGAQWRHFGGYHRHSPTTNDYWFSEGDTRSVNGGVDQIKRVLDDLRSDPSSRRHIVTAWNPTQLSQMALPPCHLLMQFQVLGGNLNGLFFMRSNDVIYGLPYNIMSYAFIVMAFSKLLGLTPGKLVYFGGDVHIYLNQLEIAEKQLERSPRSLPTLLIPDIETLDDLLALEYSDVSLIGYDPHPDFKEKPPMAV